MNATATLDVPARDDRDSAYAWYVVALLTIAYCVAFIDRQVLNLLVDPIQQDFALTDVEISLLQGLAFMGAYIVFGPPFGRWSDTGHRRNILVLGVVIWSVFTVLCGLAPGYWTLFGARAGVGAAEACLIPAAWSLISDYFTREKLARAMSIFLMGPYLGGGLALIFGGLVIGSTEAIGAAVPALDAYSGWRLTFILVGLPGVLIALWLLTVREPPRRAIASGAVEDRRFSMREVAAFLWAGRAFFLRFYAGMSLIIIVLYALPAWMPAYLMRAHGADAASVGVQYGALVLVMGSLGVLGGPVLGRWLSARGYDDTPVRVAGFAALALVPFCVALAFAPTAGAALALAAAATFCYSFPQAMAASALQFAAPNRMRGIVSSIYVFLASVMGLGIAPTLVALLTDTVFRDPNRVGESLAIVSSVAGALATYLIWRALPHYRRAVANTGAGSG
ncbi:MAG: spinster family MFS transporter [Pseudomonadota bacterium]